MSICLFSQLLIHPILLTSTCTRSMFDPSTHPSFFFCLSGCGGRRLSTVLQFLLEDPEVFIGRFLGLSLSFLLSVHVWKTSWELHLGDILVEMPTFWHKGAETPPDIWVPHPSLQEALVCGWICSLILSITTHIQSLNLEYCATVNANPPSSLVNATLRYLNTLARGKYSPPTQKKQY